jgi:hypothetical protein
MPPSPTPLAGTAAVLLLGLSGAPTLTRAESAPATGTERPAPQAGLSVAAGAFLPFTLSARSDTQPSLVKVQAGVDPSRRTSALESVVEGQLTTRISVRAGATYLGSTGETHPDAGFKLDALRQDRHGLDLAFAAAYEGQGFNLTPAVTARLAASRPLGTGRLLANLAYGHGTEAGERYGDVRLAGVQRVTASVHVGLDSRFRVDLERDDDEPPGEPEWEVVAGPIATYSRGPFVVSASGGLAATKLRLVGTRHVGLGGTLGLGAVF